MAGKRTEVERTTERTVTEVDRKVGRRITIQASCRTEAERLAAEYRRKNS